MLGFMNGLKTTSIRTKLMAAFASLAMLIAATGLSGVWFTSSVGDRAARIGENLAPHSAAALQIQLAATQARLKFKETMAGDKPEDIDEVWRLLEKAKWYANAILNGGERENESIRPTESPQVRQKMQRVGDGIDGLVKAVQERVALRAKMSDAGSEIEKNFDKTYRTVQDGIDDIIATAVTRPAEESTRALRDLGQAKYLIANARLFLEEIIAGDATKSFDAVQGDLQAARKLIGESLTTGISLRISTVVTVLDEFIALASTRHANLTGSGRVGSVMETAFDTAYETFVKVADEADAVIKSDVSQALAEFELRQDRLDLCPSREPGGGIPPRRAPRLFHRPQYFIPGRHTFRPDGSARRGSEGYPGILRRGP